MAIIGAHQSIAGGCDKAVERASRLGCDCVQLFTRNCNQWRAKDLTPPEAERFRTAVSQYGLRHTTSHACYLINLASPDDFLWRKSVGAMVVELQRAAQLGIPHVVVHPGGYTTSDHSFGIRRVVAALDEVHAQTRGIAARCLLETTAGQGTSLGWRFEHLAAMLGSVKDPHLLGFCFDTCHVFAAGYPLRTPRQYSATMIEFDRFVGLDRINAFHLNDSRAGRGSRVDRHEHIGRGKLGLTPFRLLLSDERFSKIPMYLETPKGERHGVDWDAVNLRTLRRLCE